MDIVYCSKWWLKNSQPIDIMNINLAKEKHFRGEYYTAVISENNRINYVLNISQDYIVVRFMNVNIKPYLIYEFHRIKDDDIFLKAVYFYQYDGEKRAEEMTFSFEQDGTVYMEKINLLSSEVKEKKGKVDVSCNWDKFPEFGEYENLFIKDRA